MDTKFSAIRFLAGEPFSAFAPERALLEFIQTGRVDVVEHLQIPPRDGFGFDLAMELWQVADWGPTEEASLRFVALLALLKGGAGNEAYEAPLRCVYGHLLHHCQSSDKLLGIDLFGTLAKIGFDTAKIVSLHFRNDKLGLSPSTVFKGWYQSLDQKSISWNGPCAFEEYLWNHDDEVLAELLDIVPRNEYLLQYAATFRRSVVAAWLQTRKKRCEFLNLHPDQFNALIRGDEIFDQYALEYIRESSDPAHKSPVLWQLFQLRPKVHGSFCEEYFRQPAIAANTDVMQHLCITKPELALVQLEAILQRQLYNLHPNTTPECYGAAFCIAAEQVGGNGLPVFRAVVENGDPDALARSVHEISLCANKTLQPDALEPLLIALCLHPAAQSMGLNMAMFRAVHERMPGYFTDVWWNLLDGQIPIANGSAYSFWAKGLPTGASDKKHSQNLAVSALVKNLGENAIHGARSRLSDKKAEKRISAALLLTGIGSEPAIQLLLQHLGREQNDNVRAVIYDGLKFHGRLPGLVMIPSDEAVGLIYRICLGFHKKMTKAKLPSGNWWRVENAGQLKALDGSLVDRAVSDYLIFEHSRLKIVEAAPDTLQLIACLEKKSAADFALALLNAWLAEGQDSKHRWVLALAGTLGDSRIISTLLPWIPKWCEAARHKLAEYAAQAISLLGSNEALMVLDTLATRYRSKFRNVGAAAAAAFQSAARARGISPDELGDLVVPSFDFNEEGQRRFEWEGGAAVAELTMELKLEWSDPDTEKPWKNLPAGASDAVKAEVKELGKQLRETGKAQALRLEQALVKQRRWPTAVWQDLYEKHPILRAYATRLVWGVYTTDGMFQRAFRRYPNGILADAAGAMEELPEGDVLIGLLHPLDLDSPALEASRAHLARFKILPPFPQLDRPVERLDPLTHNRRTLAVAEGLEISYSTFRSRAEKRGWTRGSVADAGSVRSYFKLFPGAGVEVSLETGDMYVGMDPMETLTLGAARFCAAGSIQRGSYVYDDPAENDPRILTFGQVPPVVYSETVSDLKAIIAKKGAEETNP